MRYNHAMTCARRCACLTLIASALAALCGGAAVSAAVAAPAATTPAATTPAPAPPSAVSTGHIAFVRLVAGGSDIWRIDPDRSHLQRLTTSHQASAPAWSADGSRIAYVDSGGIWLMHSDGSGKELAYKLDDALATSRPAWSPDGRQLAFAGHGKLYLASTTGSRKAKHIADGTNPAFSPDGKRIAYIDTQHGADARIWVAKADGHDPVALTAIGTLPRHLSWKAGSVIAFTFTEDEGAHLGIITDDGKASDSIAEGAVNVALAPDATRFVMAASTRDGQGILSVVVRGRVTPLGPGRQPDWGR